MSKNSKDIESLMNEVSIAKKIEFWVMIVADSTFLLSAIATIIIVFKVQRRDREWFFITVLLLMLLSGLCAVIMDFQFCL